MFSSGEESDGDAEALESDDSFAWSDDGSSDEDLFIKKSRKPAKAAKNGKATKKPAIESRSSSDKSDVQATRALIQRLSPAKSAEKPKEVRR